VRKTGNARNKCLQTPPAVWKLHPSEPQKLRDGRMIPRRPIAQLRNWWIVVCYLLAYAMHIGLICWPTAHEADEIIALSVNLITSISPVNTWRPLGHFAKQEWPVYCRAVANNAWSAVPMCLFMCTAVLTGDAGSLNYAKGDTIR